jgi:uncharacterized short protein YbdD (DUF466 family)
MRSDAPRASGALGSNGRRPVAAQLAALCRQLFGMPDYRSYLEHHASSHTGAPAMSEKEFFRAELERKYAGGPSRCC